MNDYMNNQNNRIEVEAVQMSGAIAHHITVHSLGVPLSERKGFAQVTAAARRLLGADYEHYVSSGGGVHEIDHAEYGKSMCTYYTGVYVVAAKKTIASENGFMHV